MASAIKRSSSENIFIAGIKKPKSSEAIVHKNEATALATWGKVLAVWHDGKFNNPATVDSVIEEFFTHDCIIDATHGCADLHSSFKVYRHADLKDYWAIFASYELQGFKPSFVASPTTDGEVWHHFEVEQATHQGTGKSGLNTSGICIVTFDGAKISKMVYIHSSPAAIAVLESKAETPVPQPVAIPSFEPAADPKAAYDTLMAAWGAGEFSNPKTKQAAFLNYVAENCVIESSSPVLPSLLKAYMGHEGFDAWNNSVVGELWELSNMDVAAAAFGKAGCVLMQMKCDIKHKTTGKEAKGVVIYVEAGYNAEGKLVYSKHYWTEPAAIAAIHAA